MKVYLKGILSCLFFISLFSATLKGQAANLPAYYPEEQAVAHYLSAMPWHLYKSYYVPGIKTWFWVDEAQDCVKDTIKSGKIWESYILNLMKKYIKPGDYVVDVGAHMGSIALAMGNMVGDSGFVYAFEGDRQLFRELYHNIYSNGKENIKPHLCWITDKEEDILCQPLTNHNYSPVCKEDKYTWLRHSRTLDSFNLENISLMKVDIECTEDEFLEGAKNTINKCRPILFIEIMGGFGHDESPEVKNRIKHTIETLKNMNYRVSQIWVDDYLALPIEKFPKK